MATLPNTTDHLPSGPALGAGEQHDTVDVVFNLVTATLPSGRKTLKFSMAAPDHPDAVVTLPDGSQQLAVPPGVVRLFRIILASEWGWKFDTSAQVGGAPIRFKGHSHAGHYHCAGAGDMAMGLIGRSTVAHGHSGAGSVHPFNVYVAMAQPGGAPDLRLRIDPDVGNPPGTPPPG
ncbi:MAG: hypothetical protein JSS36_04755 [Proteobacteria bacterium]|nr:hypothetical protein [Pseudomonadota bacterium]